MSTPTDTFRPPVGPCYPDLRGKTVLVTGGGAGLGRGISYRMAAEGMLVFLCGRREELLNEVAHNIRQAGGLAVPIAADLSREDEVARLFPRIHEHSPHIDVLVHNAALVAPGTFADTDTAYWQKMFATNSDSCFFLAKQCAQTMIPRRAGTMIFISTIGVERAHRRMIAYDASKGALEAFARALSLELAPHRIRVNAIAPGPISGQDTSKRRDSPWKRRSEKAFDPEISWEEFHHPHIPIGRFGTPADIAAAAAFLASDQASFITGTVLTVDGGATTQLAPPGIWI
ncbi:MAG TPA: SDR family oxidoreductase [Planctomycetota bacterium]|nr:SDR family oxidoreductase [Planctomycetota bacterium]